MDKLKAAKKKAEWLNYCLEIGWDKSELDGLSEVWDTFRDEYGNPKPQQPSPNPASPSLLEALRQSKVVFQWLNNIGGKGLREHDEMDKAIKIIDDALALHSSGREGEGQEELWDDVFDMVADKNKGHQITPEFPFTALGQKYHIILK